MKKKTLILKVSFKNVNIKKARVNSFCATNVTYSGSNVTQLKHAFTQLLNTTMFLKKMSTLALTEFLYI